MMIENAQDIKKPVRPSKQEIAKHIDDLESYQQNRPETISELTTYWKARYKTAQTEDANKFAYRSKEQQALITALMENLDTELLIIKN
ncbi:hypothetical protein [Bizionia myxarmorum]|uniref:Uncharacterized protein n=1 Tax=Bizionia myxarmorum TaxID=291186 RepID=A0A5D0RBN0_9FLAO|nr:hypothetical protein [Bizionia myxarmorum]TYB78311.1 hypothetical protein ES674_00595 [Bizionia myxarmorum]